MRLWLNFFFEVLNDDDKVWVDIFKIKYPNWSLYDNHQPNSSSSFLKALIQTTYFLGLNFKINLCNRTLTDLWKDPWLHEIPLAEKPTFFNMHSAVIDISLENFLWMKAMI